MGSYHNLEIKKIIRETSDTISLILRGADGKPESFLPGQFLTFLFNDDGTEVRRGYSISSSPIDLPDLRVTIKKVHDNSVSTHCIDDAKVGQIIKSLPPLGNFTIKPEANSEREYILFGAGSGITPLYSMIKTILKIEQKSKVVLVYGNRSENSIIFKNEIDDLQKEYPDKFLVIHILSQPINKWKGIRGRINKVLVSKLLTELTGIDIRKSNYYLCGPGGMMESIIDALEEFKIEPGKIHRENFTVEIINEDRAVDQKEREVTIFIKGKKNTVTVKPNETILSKALALSLDLPNSCQVGECGTCRARLLSGKLKLISQTALSDSEIKEGYCLTCVGYPASDNVVILYEDPFDD